MLTVRHSLSAAAAAALLFSAACQNKQSEANEAANPANAATQQAVPKLPIPVPQPPMNREQLLVAGLRAASAFASGADDSELQKGLANKEYEFRIRFGCDGPARAGADAPFGWTYDSASKALKVRATPELSLKDQPVKAVAGEAFETVEGFWVRRPWLLSPACPSGEGASPSEDSQAKTPKPAAPAPQMMGIAQFFTATGPRTMRRSGRPYEATRKIDTGQPPVGGFDLVLTGRLAALPDGRVIACTRSEDGERPACLISVEFGKVSIERADTHEQLAQWGPG
ncbi:MAG: hypothetical protein ACTHN4_07700 [Sphingomicrobium sp.]